MIGTTPSGAPSPQRADTRIDAPFVSFDLPFEVARLRAERAHDTEGHAGRTLTKYPDLRVVLETMKAGARIPLHETAERMTVQVIAGQLRLWTEYGDNRDLSEGSFAAIETERVHEIESLDDCAFLLTLAWPPAKRHEESEEEANGAGI